MTIFSYLSLEHTDFAQSIEPVKIESSLSFKQARESIAVRLPMLWKPGRSLRLISLTRRNLHMSLKSST